MIDEDKISGRVVMSHLLKVLLTCQNEGTLSRTSLIYHENVPNPPHGVRKVRFITFSAGRCEI